MAKTQEIINLEKKIAEGLKPNCPVCSSDLKIEETEGQTGSKGYNYSCTKSSCSLPGDMAYVPWYFVILQAGKKRVTALALVAIGAISIAGLGGTTLGFLSFDFGEEKTKKEQEETRPDNSANEKQIASLQTENSTLSDKIKDLQKQLAAKLPTTSNTSKEDKAYVWEAKRRLGLELKDSNKKESQGYLMAVLDGYGKDNGQFMMNDTEKNEIMEILARNIQFGILKGMDDLKKFETYVVDKAYSMHGRNYEHLGLVYFYMGQESGRNSEGFYQFMTKSLLNYLDFYNHLKPENTPSEGVRTSLVAAYGNAKGWKEFPNSLKKNKVEKNIRQPKDNPEINAYISILESHLASLNL